MSVSSQILDHYLSIDLYRQPKYLVNYLLREELCKRVNEISYIGSEVLIDLFLINASISISDISADDLIEPNLHTQEIIKKIASLIIKTMNGHCELFPSLSDEQIALAVANQFEIKI